MHTPVWRPLLRKSHLPPVCWYQTAMSAVACSKGVTRQPAHTSDSSEAQTTRSATKSRPRAATTKTTPGATGHEDHEPPMEGQNAPAGTQAPTKPEQHRAHAPGPTSDGKLSQPAQNQWPKGDNPADRTVHPHPSRRQTSLPKHETRIQTPLRSAQEPFQTHCTPKTNPHRTPFTLEDGPRPFPLY